MPRQTYGPGDLECRRPDVHVAPNESNAALDMAVTYLFHAGVSYTGFPRSGDGDPDLRNPMNQDRPCGVQPAGGKTMRSHTTDESSDRSRHGVAAVALVATFVAAGQGYAAGWAAYRTLDETDEPVEARVTNHARR